MVSSAYSPFVAFYPAQSNANVRFDEEFAKQKAAPEQANAPTEQHDVFRDTLLRYAGYANEFTEAGVASGNQLAKILNPFGWITVFTYGIADALNKSFNKQREIIKGSGNEKEAKAEAVSTLVENLIFHGIATWYGPVYTVIKPIAKLTEKIMSNQFKRDPRFWPSVAGLATIPFVPKVFDPITEKLMEATYQPVADKLVKSYLDYVSKKQP
jgi:fission process protein 1